MADNTVKIRMGAFPSDEQIFKTTAKLLKHVNIEMTSTKKFIASISRELGGVDLRPKKKFIKAIIAEIMDANYNHDDREGDEEENNSHNDSIASSNEHDFEGTQSLRKWIKGKTDPQTDSRVNIWSLNGFGEPVFTGGMYSSDESRTLDANVKNYCASKNLTLSQLCGGHDHIIHNKSARGAWTEIAQCLPHRTVISVYRRALRQFHGFTKGKWEEEEEHLLFRLVELHGSRWSTIQDILGRSATDCRWKFEDLQNEYERGQWSMKSVELMLKAVRAVFHVSRDDMDVRELNQWTIENDRKIPWTVISHKVKRRRLDCYFKWRQMTKRSNEKAKKLGMNPVPMVAINLKIDVRAEYFRWKAEQSKKWRQRYADEYILPQLQTNDNGVDHQKVQDVLLLDSIIQSRATRPSEVSWQTIAQKGGVDGKAPNERWEDLVDEHALDDDMDLPIWKLAMVVRDAVSLAPKKSVKSSDLIASKHDRSKVT